MHQQWAIQKGNSENKSAYDTIKKNKKLGINLTEEVKDLCREANTVLKKMQDTS